MLTSEIIEALQKSITPAQNAWCLPPAAYRGDLMETEKNKIFRTGWVSLGRADLVENTADYITKEIAGMALIITRDIAGDLRAYANSCRHRGARLVDDTGNGKGFRCPFHSWFYGLDGKLVQAPRMDAAIEFNKSDFNLIEYPIEIRAGFAFICFADNPPNIDDQLGNFTELHAPWPIDTLITTRRRTLTVACDWKAFIDVFNEYYHLPFVHADSINDIYADPDEADDCTGDYISQFGSTEGTGGLLQTQQESMLPAMPNLSGRSAAGVRYSWVFPNITFAASTDALWCYEAVPLAPGKCLVTQSTCFPPETVALPEFEQKAKDYYIRMDAALDEDIPALENQQIGLNHPATKQGRFHPLLEANVAAFAKWYAEKMIS